MKIIQKVITGSGLVVKSTGRRHIPPKRLLWELGFGTSIDKPMVTRSCVPGQKMEFRDGKRVG